MNISKDKVVALTYVLKRNGHEGEVVETVTEEKPLTFIFGSGNLLPKFEEQLEGMEKGEEFKFSLNSSEAYGDINPNAIVDVPKQAFQVDGKIDETMLVLGNTIPMMDSQGHRLNGIVKEILDETVKMDFNHPLAGEDLYFSGKVFHVREASEEELNQQSCGCGSSCGDGCEPEENVGGCGCGDGCCG